VTGAVVLVLLVAVLVLAAIRLAGSRRRRHPTPAAAPEGALEALAARARALDLRGAIVEITEADSVAGLTLRRLGHVTVVRDPGHDATGALARKAAATYPDARALTHVASTPRGNRVEWRAQVNAAEPADPADRPARPAPDAPVLVDGSNVVNWERNFGLSENASLAPLAAVLDLLAAEGRRAHVLFDASIGHALIGQHVHEDDILRALGQRAGVSVQVIPSGNVADLWLIEHAFREGAEIVTNDLYRDHPRARFLHLRRGWAGYGRAALLPLRAAPGPLGPGAAVRPGRSRGAAP
jgi:hypothetical protein